MCLTRKGIHADMVATLEDDAPDLSKVQKLSDEFRRVSESLEDNPEIERPTTANTEEHIGCFHSLLIDHRLLALNQIANPISIFHGRVENRLQNELVMSRVSAQGGVHVF